MSPKARIIISTIGAALSAAGGALITLASTGCTAGARPPGHFIFEGCVGDCPTAPPPALSDPRSTDD